MKLIFRIQYRTLWGEEVRIIFDEDENQSVALSTATASNGKAVATTSCHHATHLSPTGTLYIEIIHVHVKNWEPSPTSSIRAMPSRVVIL